MEELINDVSLPPSNVNHLDEVVSPISSKDIGRVRCPNEATNITNNGTMEVVSNNNNSPSSSTPTVNQDAEVIGPNRSSIEIPANEESGIHQTIMN